MEEDLTQHTKAIAAIGASSMPTIAIVIVDGEECKAIHYVRNPFERKLSEFEASTNLKISELIKFAE